MRQIDVLDRARLLVDFNEMIDKDLLLLSVQDSKVDSSGEEIELSEGKSVFVYEDDYDEKNEKDYLVADGICELNKIKHFTHVKWCIRIDDKGIRHLSDL